MQKFSFKNILLFVLILMPAISQGGMVKWYDDKGVAHYSDHLPPSTSRKAREEINDQGLTVKKVRAAKTPEELAQERALKTRERLFRQQRKKQETKDRVLLRTFQTEKELLSSLNSLVKTIDGRIANIQTSIHRAERKIIDDQRTAARYEKQGKAVPGVLSREIIALEKTIENSEKAIQRQATKRQKLNDKYGKEHKRFLQLKARERVFKARSNVDTGAEVHKNTFKCANVDVCKQAWAFAKNYLADVAIKHKLANPQVKSDIVLTTAKPTNDKTFSVLISREFFKKNGGRLLIIAECTKTRPGKRLCAQSKVRKIKQGLKVYLKKQLR
ncbi:MAG: DUF4124 domain-containing protein [Methylococcales bacterium]|jgi:hypothetical protein|nr:DUF4124 domain-containing protein [Methylococcales bacterium]